MLQKKKLIVSVYLDRWIIFLFLIKTKFRLILMMFHYHHYKTIDTFKFSAIRGPNHLVINLLLVRYEVENIS